MADTPDDKDKLLAAAARVADGHGVDWSREAEGLEPGVAQRLREIQALAGIFARDARLGAQLDQAPKYFGRLVVRDLLRHDHGATWHRAFDPALDREVVLKRFPPGIAASESILRRARALTRVEHPRVIALHGVAEQDGVIGVWCALIEGASLADTLRTTPPIDADALYPLALGLSAAVAAVHERGIAHGAIDAEQVFRASDGGWSLSGLTAVAAQFPADGRNHAAEPRPRDLREDARALCLLIARAVSPMRRDDEAAINRADIPADFARTIERGLAPGGEGGFASARELVEALRATRRERGGLGAVVSLWRRLRSRD